MGPFGVSIYFYSQVFRYSTDSWTCRFAKLRTLDLPLPT